MLIADIWRITSVARVSLATRSKRWMAEAKSLFAIAASPWAKSKLFLLFEGMISRICRASAGCFASVPPTLISISTSLNDRVAMSPSMSAFLAESLNRMMSWADSGAAAAIRAIVIASSFLIGLILLSGSPPLQVFLPEIPDRLFHLRLEPAAGVGLQQLALHLLRLREVARPPGAVPLGGAQLRAGQAAPGHRRLVLGVRRPLVQHHRALQVVQQRVLQLAAARVDVALGRVGGDQDPGTAVPPSHRLLEVGVRDRGERGPVGERGERPHLAERRNLADVRVLEVLPEDQERAPPVVLVLGDGGLEEIHGLRPFREAVGRREGAEGLDRGGRPGA